MKLQAHGQNVIIKPLTQYDDTWKGEVVLSPWKQKMSVGTIVFYPEKMVKNFTVPHGDGHQTFHVIWEPQIFCVAIDDKEVDEIAKTLPDLTVTQEMIDKENARIKK